MWPFKKRVNVVPPITIERPKTEEIPVEDLPKKEICNVHNGKIFSTKTAECVFSGWFWPSGYIGTIYIDVYKTKKGNFFSVERRSGLFDVMSFKEAEGAYLGMTRDKCNKCRYKEIFGKELEEG